MKKLIFVWLITAAFVICGFGQSAKVKNKDLQNLTGAQWIGTLSYLDYGTDKKVSIDSNLTVTQSKEDKSSWIFEFQYPREPKANRQETVRLSADGKILDGDTIIERAKLSGETLKIVTEKSGSDNDKKAMFRFTYLLSKSAFSIRKEVSYEGTTNFFLRNEYRWKR